jgi:FixJ family two-component response regulator
MNSTDPIVFVLNGDPGIRNGLLEAIRAAISHDRNSRAQRAADTDLRQRYSSLTARERQVMSLVVSGLRNKQSAWELGISEFTLQIHRAQVMQKMRAPSIADLVRMAATLKVPHYVQQLPGSARLSRQDGKSALSGWP